MTQAQVEAWAGEEADYRRAAVRAEVLVGDTYWPLATVYPR
jgi:hypothetical protein